MILKCIMRERVLFVDIEGVGSCFIFRKYSIFYMV